MAIVSGTFFPTISKFYSWERQFQFSRGSWLPRCSLQTGPIVMSSIILLSPLILWLMYKSPLPTEFSHQSVVKLQNTGKMKSNRKSSQKAWHFSILWWRICVTKKEGRKEGRTKRRREGRKETRKERLEFWEERGIGVSMFSHHWLAVFSWAHSLQFPHLSNLPLTLTASQSCWWHWKESVWKWRMKSQLSLIDSLGSSDPILKNLINLWSVLMSKWERASQRKWKPTSQEQGGLFDSDQSRVSFGQTPVCLGSLSPLSERLLSPGNADR